MFLGNHVVCQTLGKHIVEDIYCELLFTRGELSELGNLEKCIVSANATRTPVIERGQDQRLKRCQSSLGSGEQ